ncbi:hypothetical protein KM043_006829 [Ampulex compressa]|nr:hypothetical protein KM043_006829 [Ampulex compressa]
MRSLTVEGLAPDNTSILAGSYVPAQYACSVSNAPRVSRTGRLTIAGSKSRCSIGLNLSLGKDTPLDGDHCPGTFEGNAYVVDGSFGGLDLKRGYVMVGGLSEGGMG